ncbi:hypothetical protein BH11ACT8_BH11ACT8_29630 [soil metagenome]
MDIDVSEPEARSLRARRRALLRLGVALFAAAVLVPLAVVSVLSGDDDVTSGQAPPPPAPPPTGPIAPPGPLGTARPIGYLVHGAYHSSTG